MESSSLIDTPLHASPNDHGGYDIFVRNVSQPAVQDIPIWGSLVTSNVPEAAKWSLSAAETEILAIEYIIVARNAHLDQVKFCGAKPGWPEAALYLRVYDIFSMFYATWDSDPFHGDLFISFQIPQHNFCRSSVLDALVYRREGMIAAGVMPAEPGNRRGACSIPVSCRDDTSISRATAFMRNMRRLPQSDSDDVSSSSANDSVEGWSDTLNVVPNSICIVEWEHRRLHSFSPDKGG